jgi:VanZ family protein
MRLLFLAAFAAALAFTLIMAWLPHPPALPIEESDKFWHVLAFATLALLASLAFPAVQLLRIGERLSFLGALIELVQSIPALQRDCDIRDWIADTLAAAVTLALVAGMRRLRARRPRDPRTP